jgi:glycosyltransferase involved in cell wall biosynthesis
MNSTGPVLAVDAVRMEERRTGIENYLHHLLPGIVRAWAAGGDGVPPGTVTVFARSPDYATHVSPRPQVVVQEGRGWTQSRLRGALRAADAAVYFTPIPILPVISGLPCPAVVTVHDFHDFRARWWYFRRLLQRTFAKAEAIVCVSQASHQEVIEEFPDAASKTVVIRQGADATVFHPGSADDPAILQRLGIPASPLLAVGTIQPRKNYVRLVRAYATLPAGAPPLVIVGRNGWEYEDVLALPGELGIAERVVFTGHLPEPDIGDLMRASVLLCAVSTAEGFGLPLVEAMYCGLPILASDIPPFREVAGTAARFVDPMSEAAIATGLRLMLDDPAARAEMGAAGTRRRALFSWDAAAEAIVGTLRGALTSV